MPKNFVHKILLSKEPNRLEFRRPSSKKERKRHFSYNGPLNIVSLDGLRNCVDVKIGLPHRVCMDVLTLISERSYFCDPAT